MTERYDAIIIGAGIIGTATSYALRKKGWGVLNIDKLPTCGYGSTAGSTAIVQPCYSTLDESALACESHHYWSNWSAFIGGEEVDERGLARYKNCGSLVMKTEQNGYLESACLFMDQLNSTYENLNAEQAKQKLPIVTMDSFAPVKRVDDPGFGIPNKAPLRGAVFFRDAGYVNDPQLAAHNILRAAEAAGSKFIFGERVKAIRQQHGRVCGVTLENGDQIDSSVVLNAAGPHSYRVNAMAGIDNVMKIKTRALRHEVAQVPMPGGFNGARDGCVTSDDDIGIYMRPEHRTHFLIGSESPKGEKREWVDPDNFEPHFTQQWRAQVMRACQRIPSLSMPTQLRGVVELYDVSDDWKPIYDKSDLPGYYMAIGTSGHQFKTAPLVGELMAELIETSEGGNNQDENPIEFQLKHIGYTLNSGFYSRLREVNKTTSVPDGEQINE